jgi:hypothetical protein
MPLLGEHHTAGAEMSEIRVDISEVLEKLDMRVMKDVVADALGGAADIIRADIKTYPGRQSSGPQQWKSDRQRRWFFAALRRGEIQVPYRRQGTLGRSWTREIDRSKPAAIIGTHVKYAPYVQDANRQAPMHARNAWTTAQDVVQKKSRAVVRFLEQALSRWAR